ncbi:MAG: hypothetical protein ACOYMF_05410 [Bacteroidales bacterium]
MITIFRVIIVVATFSVLGSSPEPCNTPTAFSGATLDTIVTFEGNCPQCADQVYNQASANLWKLQPGLWNLIVKVERDTTYTPGP